MSKQLSWLWTLFGVLLILGVVAAIELAQVQTSLRAGSGMLPPAVTDSASSLA